MGASRIAGYTNFSLTNNIANEDMEVNGDPIPPGSVDTSVNGADKSSADLELQSTYTALSWDFSTVWKMSGDSPSRPILKWQ
jgi:hypothetical protein